jgi:hypothetical protein
MKRFYILGFFWLLLLPGTPVLAQFSQLNPPPPGAPLYPFTQSAATKRLPADKMNHLLAISTYGISRPNCPYGSYTVISDCLAQNSFGWNNAFNESGAVDLLGIFLNSPASDGTPSNNDLSKPIYYTGAPDPNSGLNDPVYSMCGASYDKNVCVIFHAPSNAYWTGAGRNSSGDDEFIGFWDVTWGVVVSAYGFHNSSSPLGIGKCPSNTHQGTATDPCPVDGGNGAGYTALSAQQIGVDQDWNWGGKTRTASIGGVSTVPCSPSPCPIAFGGADDNMPFFAWGALLARFNEISTGQILHPVQGSIGCTNASQPTVFPSISSPLRTAACTNSKGPFSCPWCVSNGVAPGGSHIFVDYTDAQIAAMGVPTLQAAFLYQLAHYGTYLADYGGTSSGFGATQFAESSESGQGYVGQVTNCGHSVCQHPLYESIDNTYIGSTLASGEPNYVGQIPIECGNHMTPPESQYRCLLTYASHGYGQIYGIPLATGPACPNTPCDVFQHMHILDPSAEPVIATFGNSWHWAGGTLPAQATGEIEIQIVGKVAGGTVTSNPAGSDCDHTGYCEIGYAVGKPITFTAKANPGYTFAGWSGSGCSGTSSCTITTATGPAQQASAKFVGAATHRQ